MPRQRNCETNPQYPSGTLGTLAPLQCPACTEVWSVDKRRLPSLPQGSQDSPSRRDSSVMELDSLSHKTIRLDDAPLDAALSRCGEYVLVTICTLSRHQEP